MLSKDERIYGKILLWALFIIFMLVYIIQSSRCIFRHGGRILQCSAEVLYKEPP